MDSPRELKVSICKIPDWTTGDQHPILNLTRYSNVQKTDVHMAWIMRVHGGDVQMCRRLMYIRLGSCGVHGGDAQLRV